MVNSKMALLSLLLLTATLPGCQPQTDTPLSFTTEVNPVQPQPKLDLSAPVEPTEDSKRVLLVINAASGPSAEIGAYYRAKRQIPKENVVIINVSTTENINETEFNTGIKAPIQAAISASKNKIDFIVLTDGTPIRLNDNNGYSVDGYLATMNVSLTPIPELKSQGFVCPPNPYYGSTERFSSSKYKIYLVTRLIGYTTEDAKKLVDNSIAAKAAKGPFLLDEAGNRKGGGYGQLQSLMERSAASLEKRGFNVVLDKTDEFQEPKEPLMGYVNWGSNDGAFSNERYKNVKFLPGAICETFVSTSARTFKPTQGGQSLIADLIKSGVTGVKGYVSEPYTFALAQPDILFDRYTQGYNLAESFYAASQVIRWKDVVVGDPLCNPYQK
jgi:uncharacterized protein (TIGR03790 family)